MNDVTGRSDIICGSIVSFCLHCIAVFLCLAGIEALTECSITAFEECFESLEQYQLSSAEYGVDILPPIYDRVTWRHQICP